MAQNNLPERLELGPLSPAQRRDVQKIKSAYEDFWSNLKFKKGWEKPAFAKEEVTWMLEIAAEVVVHVRTMLDAVNPGFKIRVLDGSAREYLWTVDKKPDSIDFLRDIIHQTFKNIDGYVEGLTAELLDSYIDQCFEYLDVHDTLTKEKEVQYIRVRCMEIYERVKDKYLQSESERLQQALALMKDRELASESAEWRKVMKSLHTIDQCLDDIIKLRESALQFKQQQEATVEEVQTPQPQEEPQSEQSPETAPETVQEQSHKQEESLPEEQPQVEPQAEQAELQVEQVESQVTPSEPQQEQQVEEEKQAEESTQSEEIKSEDSAEPSLSTVAESQGDSEEAFEDDESDTSSDSESERPPSLRASQDDSTMLSVLRVGDEIPRVQQQIAALNAELEKLGQNQDQQDTATALSQVSALQRRTNGAFETLFADLTSLDALDLHGSPKARAARKEQVNRIQALLSQLESMQDTLKGMKSHLMEKKQQQDEQKSKEEQAAKAQAAAAAEQEAKEKPRPKAKKEKQQSGPIVIHSQGQEDDEEEEEGDVEEEEVVRKARWRSLKLQPRMDVEETEKAYIITSYIPGMDRDDISVSLGQNNTLVICGFRCPSVEEELAMRQMIRQEYAQRARESLLLYGPVRHPKLTPEQEDALVLRAGAGRYGTFQKAFQLPFKGMHSKQINASYEGGVIKVVVPKKATPPRRQAVPLPVKTRPPEPMHDPRAAMYGGYPGVFGGFPASTRPSRQARGPFYNDSDFWW